MPTQGEVRTANGETRQWTGSRWEPVSAEAADTGVPMYHPNLGDDYTSAFINEVARTGKEAAIGLARSPLDLVKNTLGMVAHPIDTVTNTAKTLAHPIDTVKALGDNPREAGSVLGQLVLGKIAPDALAAASEKVPAVGRGLQTVGKGLEDAGNAVFDRAGTPIGVTAAGTALAGHPGIAAAEVGIPLAAKYGGKGMQAVGRSLEGLQRATVGPYVPNESGYIAGRTLSNYAPGEALAGLETPQGTYIKIGDNWGVTGKGLTEGGTVNVSSSNGTQRLMTIDKVLADEHGTQIATLK